MKLSKSTPFRFHFRGIKSGETFLPDRAYYTAPGSNELLLVERDEDFIKSKIGHGTKARNFLDAMHVGTLQNNYPNGSGIWSWRKFILPGFPEEAIISMNEGRTDLFEVPQWLTKELGMSQLFIKMEGQAPSASFKDRGMSVAVSDVRRLQLYYPELGIEGISCASTGDTSAAAAIYAAYTRDTMSCVVLVPHEQITESQLFQAMAYGAKVVAVTHKDGFDGCRKLIQQFGKDHPELVVVNSANAMRIVGQETIGLEILQDLQWEAPDWIAIPVGNGGNLTALMITLLRAKEYGLIDRLPGIIVGQAEAANTLVRWEESDYTAYIPGPQKPTLASAMNINDAVSFPRIETLYQKFRLKCHDVAEDQIADTWARFLRAGASICPQTAVALSAVIQAREDQTVKKDETAVVISTASGIKFAEAGLRYHLDKGGTGAYRNPFVIAGGTIEEIEAALK